MSVRPSMEVVGGGDLPGPGVGKPLSVPQPGPGESTTSRARMVTGSIAIVGPGEADVAPWAQVSRTSRVVVMGVSSLAEREGVKQQRQHSSNTGEPEALVVAQLPSGANACKSSTVVVPTGAATGGVPQQGRLCKRSAPTHGIGGPARVVGPPLAAANRAGATPKKTERTSTAVAST